jgi:muramoyltetrapeptide carboxypeptidase LdcA involved in peptidoglycan recycling
MRDDWRVSACGSLTAGPGRSSTVSHPRSSPAEEHVSELQETFAEAGVTGMLAFIGGYNSNQLLARLD